MKKLYTIEGKGVQIVDYVFQKPNAREKLKRVFGYIVDNITPVKNDKEENKSSRFKSSKSLQEKLPENIKDDPIFSEWLSGHRNDLIENDTIWRLGRVVVSAFINILYMCKTWGKPLDQPDLMKDILTQIGIFDKLRSVYDKPDDLSMVYRYYFSQIIGKSLVDSGKTLESIKEPLVTLMLKYFDEIDIDEVFIKNPSDFVRDHLQLFSTPVSSGSIIQISERDNFVTCTACGKQMKKLRSEQKTMKQYKWKSSTVPSGVPVEKFSNFLEAGMRSKAVRMICESCKWRYYLDVILSSVDGKNISSWYCTFYTRDGIPFDAILSIQRQVQRMRENIADGKESFVVIPKDGSFEMRMQNSHGFMLPSIPDEICGSITIDWKIKNDPVTEQFWEVLTCVLSIVKETGMRCIVTKLRNDYDDLICAGKDILFQDVPQDFKWLLGGKDWLLFEDIDVVLSVIEKINMITKQIKGKQIKGKDTQKLGTSILKLMKNDDLLPAIHYIECKWDDERKKKNSVCRAVCRAYYLDCMKEIYVLQKKISTG
jgi:hypothetical protein